MNLDPVRKIADAVLYEGYILYPYRASSQKNQSRWQFGVVMAPGYAAADPSETSFTRAECVLEHSGQPSVRVLLRFLQVQSRVVQRRTTEGWSDVDELLVDGARWIPYHEAVPREVSLQGLGVHDVAVPGGEDVEELRADGEVVGRLVRTR